MSFRLNTQFAVYQLSTHTDMLNQSLQRLSSGYRINRAADDPSGLAIADKLRAQIRGLQQSSKNIVQAESMIQSVDDGMSQMLTHLYRVKDLATEAANGSLADSDRSVNQTEVAQILAEIDRLATAVRFNGIKLLNGTFASRGPTGALYGGGSFVGSLVFHVGPSAGQTFSAFISTQTARAIGVSGINVATQLGASNGVNQVNSAVSHFLSRRARIGAYESRLQVAQSLVDLETTSHLDAESSIRDADTATEIMNFTKEQILVQASTAVIAQANVLSQSVLKLLQFQ